MPPEEGKADRNNQSAQSNASAPIRKNASQAGLPVDPFQLANENRKESAGDFNDAQPYVSQKSILTGQQPKLKEKYNLK